MNQGFWRCRVAPDLGQATGGRALSRDAAPKAAKEDAGAKLRLCRIEDAIWAADATGSKSLNWVLAQGAPSGATLGPRFLLPQGEKETHFAARPIQPKSSDGNLSDRPLVCPSPA